MGQELLHRLLGPLHPVGVVDVLNLRPQPGGVSQQLDQRRFVGDQRPQLVGVGGDQRKSDQGAAAAAKDVRRAPPSADSSRWRSSACWAGVTSSEVSSRLLLAMPRGSEVTTV
jgi:hypothetical protein